jgi:phospholipid/cholesterol/gamma-HCH transport system ATP-binding protein
MERTGDEDDRPLEPRDWEETRGEEQQEPHPDPHEQPTAVEREQAYHDEPGGPGTPEAMDEGEPGAEHDEPRAEEDEPRADEGEPPAGGDEGERAGGDGSNGGAAAGGAAAGAAAGGAAAGAAAARPRGTGEMTHERGSQAEAEEYQWHTGTKREHGADDAVEFIDVVKAFGRNRVLNGLNLGLPNDQISMILGPSGTGKSVCIKHMVGLLYPDEGDVLVHGESVPSMADDELFEMRKKFGVLFQDGALFGSMNVYDNTAFPLRQHTDKGEEEIREIVSRRLGEVGLAAAAEKMPNELSGGMRKRAGFARALVLDPDIVLFDEPDSGLDPVRTALLCELIMEVHEENGGAYCVITHDIMSARRVADYIAILWKGRIVESGPASELFNSDNQFVRQFLSGEAQGPLGME